MKKLSVAFFLIFVILSALTGCGITKPRPEIKEGRFDISVTYEHNGEMKTLSGVYVCEYDGVVWYNVNGDAFVNWKTHFEGELNADSIPVCTTDDGGEIFISLLLYPEYFMGDPDYAEYTPLVRAELWYPDAQTVDADVIAEHGVKLIGYQCDAPIENSYQ